MPHPTTANMADVDEILKRVASPISAPTRSHSRRQERPSRGELRSVRRRHNARLPSVSVERVTLAACYPVNATGGGRNSAIIRRNSANRFFEIATRPSGTRHNARGERADRDRLPNGRKGRRAGRQEQNTEGRLPRPIETSTVASAMSAIRRLRSSATVG